jgi:biopolymer transport protein ExbB/TolQ
MEHVVWTLVRQSDAVSQSVLLVLVIMSIACWTVAAYKMLLLHFKTKDLQRAKLLLDKATTIDEALSSGVVVENSPLGPLVSYVKARFSLESSVTDSASMQQYLDRAIDEMLYQEEEYVSILKVSAEVAPLIGLFGTVWGLIHSFIRISTQQSADIVTVAPGISEALITTLMGLIVAIPALILFHQVHNKIKTLEYYLENGVDRLFYLANNQSRQGIV